VFVVDVFDARRLFQMSQLQQAREASIFAVRYLALN